MPLAAVIVIAVLIVAVAGLVLVRWRSSPRATQEVPAPEPTTTGLAAKLGKSRAALGGRLPSVFGRGTIDDSVWDSLEETLIRADVGVGAATAVVASVREAEPEDAGAARSLLRDALTGLLADRDRDLHLIGRPAVIVVVGVNGTGKTTSIAKLASQLQARGSAVLLGAADTYRAAADEQLRAWAERVGVQMVGGQEGADPAAVAYDSYEAATARGKDVLIVDTAGRLHSNRNLMEELGKVVRVLRREAKELSEVLLVIDGTTGQNAIAQARTFTETVGVTGVVLTKLDGTARGGAAVAVERELDVPVKFIGVGEGVEDLIPFDPEEFIDALLEG